MGDDERAEKKTERHKLAEDEHPHHRVARESFEDTPSRLFLFAICNRHPISRMTGYHRQENEIFVAEQT